VKHVVRIRPLEDSVDVEGPMNEHLGVASDYTVKLKGNTAWAKDLGTRYLIGEVSGVSQRSKRKSEARREIWRGTE
jgi:hypothetical protein